MIYLFLSVLVVASSLLQDSVAQTPGSVQSTTSGGTQRTAIILVCVLVPIACIFISLVVAYFQCNKGSKEKHRENPPPPSRPPQMFAPPTMTMSNQYLQQMPQPGMRSQPVMHGTMYANQMGPQYTMSNASNASTMSMGATYASNMQQPQASMMRYPVQQQAPLRY